MCKIGVGICVNNMTRKNVKFPEKEKTLIREECKVTITLSPGTKKIPEWIETFIIAYFKDQKVFKSHLKTTFKWIIFLLIL